jgi:hypothetical protein
MPLTTIPAIDAAICSGWTEQQVDLYNKLPYYLAKMQVGHRSTWATWAKFLGTRKWQRNQGDTLKAVSKEPSPHVRQTASPRLVSEAPKKDVIQVRERTSTASVYRHRFESLNLHFLPDFQDFMNDHVDAAGKDILEKQTRFEDLFYRTHITAKSPKMWITGKANGEFIAAPYELPTETVGAGNIVSWSGANAKTAAWFQARIAELGAAGGLGFEAINRIVTAAENDERILPFSGSDIAKQDSGLSGKFALVCSSELYNSFTFDPYLQQNKNCQLDVVNGRFVGSLFGRVTCIIEDKPFRMTESGTFVPPETVELNEGAHNYGESVPNPAYFGLEDTDSPYEIAYLVGAQGYERIEVGPPPSAFSGNGMPKGFGKMFWNGEIMITKNILVPCPTDADPNAVDTNSYGEWLRFQSQAVFGLLPTQRRNIIPILFKRKRGA